jgi:hypothetical protein
MKSDGHLIVEFSLAVGFSAFLLSGAVALLRLHHERQAMQLAARMGALVQSRSGVSENAARAQIDRYLAEENILDARITLGRFADTSAARFYSLRRARIEKGPLSAEAIVEQEEQ